MSEIIKLQFYRILKCGYYRYGEDSPAFGNVGDILNQLTAWVFNGEKTLGETCTYELEEGEDSCRTFCFDIKKHEKTGDFVLVTWNEAPTNEGRVVTVNGKQPVGGADVNFTPLPDGSIPGYATYFWFIPSKNVFATIRFQHTQLIGKSNLERYLREYCAKFTSYVVLQENSEGAEIQGYSKDGEEIKHMRADFKAYVYRKSGQLDALRKGVTLITKIIRKNRLSPQIVFHTSVWQKMLEGLGVAQEDRTLKTDVKIKYEIPFNPSLEQLNAMIDEWEDNHESKWDDIGFKLSGDEEVHWLSNSVAKTEHEVDVKRNNDEVVDASSLLEALTNKRDIFLSLIT